MEEFLSKLTIEDYKKIVGFLAALIPATFIATYKYLGNHLGYKKSIYKEKIEELKMRLKT